MPPEQFGGHLMDADLIAFATTRLTSNMTFPAFGSSGGTEFWCQHKSYAQHKTAPTPGSAIEKSKPNMHPQIRDQFDRQIRYEHHITAAVAGWANRSQTPMFGTPTPINFAGHLTADHQANFASCPGAPKTLCNPIPRRATGHQTRRQRGCDALSKIAAPESATERSISIRETQTRTEFSCQQGLVTHRASAAAGRATRLLTPTSSPPSPSIRLSQETTASHGEFAQAACAAIEYRHPQPDLCARLNSGDRGTSVSHVEHVTGGARQFLCDNPRKDAGTRNFGPTGLRHPFKRRPNLRDQVATDTQGKPVAQDKIRSAIHRTKTSDGPLTARCSSTRRDPSKVTRSGTNFRAIWCLKTNRRALGSARPSSQIDPLAACRAPSFGDQGRSTPPESLITCAGVGRATRQAPRSPAGTKFAP